MLRIWHQSTTDLSKLANYRAELSRHFKQLYGEESTLFVDGVKPGTYLDVEPSRALGAPSIHSYIGRQLLQKSLIAEEQGFDAFVIGSFSEPFLDEIRSIVSIPVVSLLESSLRVAESMGCRYIAISNSIEISALVRKALYQRGVPDLDSVVTQVRPSWYESALNSVYDDPSDLVARLTEGLEKYAADGYELVIPAEGVMALALASNRIGVIAGLEVLDVFHAVWEYAAMMHRLRSAGLTGRNATQAAAGKTREMCRKIYLNERIPG